MNCELFRIFDFAIGTCARKSSNINLAFFSLNRTFAT